MAKKNRKLTYWERRAVEQEMKINDGLKPMEDMVAKAYRDANKYLTKETKKIFDRYLNKSDYTEDEVINILNTNIPSTEIVKLTAMVSAIKDPTIKKRTQDYLTGLAVKSRITRLEDLKAKSYIVSKQIADAQLTLQTDYYIDVIQEAYNRGAAEAIIGKSESALRLYDDGKYPTYVFEDGKSYIELTNAETGDVVKRINVTKDAPVKEFKEMSTKEVKNVLETKWVGSNYSERIWKDTDLLANKLQEMFAVEAMTGMSENEMAKMLQNQFNVSYGIARRLIRTEANYMATQAKLKSLEKNGIEEYRILAVMDLRTSDICQNQDGKVYKVKDAKPGINCPAFHPWCRSVIVAHFKHSAIRGTLMAYNPLTDDTVEIKYTDTYKDWEKKILAQSSREELSLQKKKVIHFNEDNAQFKRYKQRLGADNKELPKKLADFQDIKYNESKEYERLKKLYRNSLK